MIKVETETRNKRKQKKTKETTHVISYDFLFLFHVFPQHLLPVPPVQISPIQACTGVNKLYTYIYIYIYMIPLDISALKRPPTNQHLIAFRRSKSKFVLFFGNIISLMRAVHFNFIALIDRLLTRSAEEKHDLIIFDS